MRTTSNWPGGVDLGHSNHTLKFPRCSRFGGHGAWASDSSKIPLWPSLGFIGAVVLFVWCIWRLPLLIWG